jgi:hypothetical protein
MFDTTAHDFASGKKFSDGSFSVRDASLRQVCFVIFFAVCQSRLFALLRPIYW